MLFQRGSTLCAAKVTVKWLTKWICTHPNEVKNIYASAIKVTKGIKKDQKNKQILESLTKQILTKQEMEDSVGILFFNMLPKAQKFKKALKKRIKEKVGTKPKTAPSPTGETFKIRDN